MLNISNLNIFFCLIIVAYMQFFFIDCEDKHFVIIIPSYNNEQFCEKNLNSVFSQEYSNYEVIYIDDYSEDDTYNKVKDYIKTNSSANNVTLLRNFHREYKLHNLYISIHSCLDNYIVLILDGDDWFKDNQVLRYLNDHVYNDKNILIAYSGFVSYPDYQVVVPRHYSDNEIEHGAFRDNHHYYATGCLSFYAWLFKKIHLKDLLNEDMFIDIGSDMAIFFPMMEMARYKHRVVERPLIFYNRTNNINDYKVNHKKQIFMGQEIRSRKRYFRIK